MDIAAEQMLQPVEEQPAENGIWDDDALVAHIDNLIAEQQDQIMEHAASSGSRKPIRSKTLKKQNTSMMNPSTVWFGDTPIVLREDLATPVYYVFCKQHACNGKQCRKDIQINRPDRDTVIRTLFLFRFRCIVLF